MKRGLLSSLVVSLALVWVLGLGGETKCPDVSKYGIDEVSEWSGSSVKVAVIDTGLDSSHSRFSRIVDRDNWNFVTKSRVFGDSQKHGTHVSGIIAEVARGRVNLLPLVFYSERDSGTVNLKRTIEAIKYAVDHGAKIINYSGGGPEYSEEEFRAVKYASDRGVLFVAAAGNEATDLDSSLGKYYPASYELPNVVSVMSADASGKVSDFSNWGKSSVDLAAPGDRICSTHPRRAFGIERGTSQSTAFVTGAAAIVWSLHPELDAVQVKNKLLQGVLKLPSLVDKNVSGGFLSIKRALQ